MNDDDEEEDEDDEDEDGNCHTRLEVSSISTACSKAGENTPKEPTLVLVILPNRL